MMRNVGKRCLQYLCPFTPSSHDRLCMLWCLALLNHPWGEFLRLAPRIRIQGSISASLRLGSMHVAEQNHRILPTCHEVHEALARL